MPILATLTKSGRAAIAAAIAARPIHLGWGYGLEEWDDMEDGQLPSLVDRESLFNELGRRLVSVKGFAEPDDNGGIVVPTGLMPDGSVQSARYRPPIPRPTSTSASITISPTPPAPPSANSASSWTPKQTPTPQKTFSRRLLRSRQNLVKQRKSRDSSVIEFFRHMPPGAKSVVFTGQSGTTGSAVFIGQGTLTVQTMRNVTNLIGYRNDPLAQTFMLEKTAMIGGIDLWFTKKKTEVRIQIRNVENGMPTSQVLAECSLKPEQITVNGQPTRA